MLEIAANYFMSTEIEAWDGYDWVSLSIKGTLLPYDRFISEREFGLKRRMLLVDVSDPIPDQYSVIRLPGPVAYMVGSSNMDIQEYPYSKIVLLHKVEALAQIYEWVKTPAASGLGGSSSRVLQTSVWADLERVTNLQPIESPSTTLSQLLFTLPSTTSVTTNNEISMSGRFYDVRESYESAGFRHCRVIEKRSS